MFSSFYTKIFATISCQYIDGLHLTSWRPCWRYNTKEYFISSIVESSRRGLLAQIGLITNQELWKNYEGRSSLKIQLKIEFLLPYTGSTKVLENIPD